MAENERLALIAEVAAAYLRRNALPVDQVGRVFGEVTRALDAATTGQGNGVAVEGGGGEMPSPFSKKEPAVPIKKSVQHDFLVCLECGVQAKTLKRHLGSAHQLTPESYRERWSLAKDYPITAPAYSERRSKMAKKLGLGRTAGGRRKR